MNRGVWGAAVGVVLGPLVYLLTWPSPIDPVAWYPEAAPAPVTDERLGGIEKLDLGGAVGGEDVVVDAAGRIYTGVSDGRILRFEPGAAAPVEHANTGGRPLGMDLALDGGLLVADGVEGLVLVHPEGQVEKLDIEAEGERIHFADDVEVGADNIAYVTDASWKFGYKDWPLDVLESRPNGRLVAVDLETMRGRQVREDLFFPNGVALDPQGRFALVCETTRYRVVRIWLGDRFGEADVLVDNLPGFPDGITGDDQGNYWIAIVTPRNPTIDRLAPWPLLRKVITRLPPAVRPEPERRGYVVRIDSEGRVLDQIADPGGATIGMITAAEPYGEWLYLGTLGDPVIGRLKITGGSAPPGGGP